MLPQPFIDRLRVIVPREAFSAVLDSFDQIGPVGFRANTLLAPTAESVARLLQASIPVQSVSWYDAGFTVPAEHRKNLVESDAYRQRHLYLQNLSSMVPVVELAVRPGETVLDLAAAPGSKTLQLAAAMNGEGDLAAVEVVRKRFFKLKRNLSDHGATGVRVYLQDGRRAATYRPDHFDRVLLDAPCSTEGRFRSDEPETFRYWSPRKIREMAHKQAQLLEAAIRCTKPGGVTVYSTCSFAPEENEAVVQGVLDVFGDSVAVEPLTADVAQYSPALREWDGIVFDPDIRHARRILPDGPYEAFFVCRLRRLA